MLIACAIGAFYAFGGEDYLSLPSVQANLSRLQELHETRPVLVIGTFLGIYLFLTTLSIPGTIILTLLSGAIFGVAKGIVIIMIGTTFGAVFSFLLSRYLFRDYFTTKFRKQFEEMNRRVRTEGNQYLFTLRMIPVSPYVVINVVMGLTNMRLLNFALLTFLGMLPGTSLYVYAGRRISEIDSVTEILTWKLAIGLTLLGVLPVIVRKLLKTNRRRRSGELLHE